MQLVPTDKPAGDHRAARLRKLIARKRAERRRLERNMDAMRTQVAELAALRERRLAPVDHEVHEHFRWLLAECELGPDLEAAVEGLYRRLMHTGTISARPLPGDRDEPREHDEACPCRRCRAAADDPEARIPAPPRRGGTDPASLRSLYRELATRYHPDKATDESTRAENERLMREINGAYHAGDLDALAALSQELGFSIAGDGVLEALAAQYEQLKAEVRSLRHDPLGRLVVETRRAGKHGYPAPLADMTAQTHHHADHLENLAGLLGSYRGGDLPPGEFFYELLRPADDDGDFMDQLLAMLDLEPGHTPRRKRKPGRKR